MNTIQYWFLFMFIKKVQMKKNIVVVFLLLICGEVFAIDGMIYVKGGLLETKRDSSDDHWKRINVKVDDFYMDIHEVTVADFEEFVQSTGYKTQAEKKGWAYVYKGERRSHVNWKCDVFGHLRKREDYNRPVLFVAVIDAQEYAEWCGKRLPTEAEWEYAAKGGAMSKNYRYPGSNRLLDVAVYDESGIAEVNNVGSLKPNELGLYDMFGNVYEMCSDTRVLSNTEVYVVKGGAFIIEKERMDYHLCWYAVKTEPSVMIGFRCVK